MKKILIISACMVIYLQAYNQSIGINTNAPHPSAVLDINSSNKGVLIPKIFLNSTTDNASIPNPANGLLVYNTNNNLPDSSGFYYNKGDVINPSWISLKAKKFSLPYKDSVNSSGNAMEIKNAGTGNALVVDGMIKIKNTLQHPGKVLMTSGLTGDTNWEGGVAFAAGSVGTVAYPIPANQYIMVPVKTKYYDIGLNFVTSSSIFNPNTFITPANGIYHFDATIMWNGFAGNINDAFGSLAICVNGIPTFDVRHYAGTAEFSNQLSTDILLHTGDKVTLVAYQNSSVTQTISKTTGTSRFSGRFVSTAN